MLHLGDLLLLGVQDGALPVRRYFQEPSLAPNPTRNITALREDISLLWLYLDISEEELLENSDVVLSCFSLIVSTHY